MTPLLRPSKSKGTPLTRSVICRRAGIRRLFCHINIFITVPQKIQFLIKFSPTVVIHATEPPNKLTVRCSMLLANTVPINANPAFITVSSRTASKNNIFAMQNRIISSGVFPRIPDIPPRQHLCKTAYAISPNHTCQKPLIATAPNQRPANHKNYI